jgi:hypothetical protein
MPIRAFDGRRCGGRRIFFIFEESFKAEDAVMQNVLNKRFLRAGDIPRGSIPRFIFNSAALDLTGKALTLIVLPESPDVSENQVRAPSDNKPVNTPLTVRWYGLGTMDREIGSLSGGVVWRNARQLFPGGGFSESCNSGLSVFNPRRTRRDGEIADSGQGKRNKVYRT